MSKVTNHRDLIRKAASLPLIYILSRSGIKFGLWTLSENLEICLLPSLKIPYSQNDVFRTSDTGMKIHCRKTLNRIQNLTNICSEFSRSGLILKFSKQSWMLLKSNLGEIHIILKNFFFLKKFLWQMKLVLDVFKCVSSWTKGSCRGDPIFSIKNGHTFFYTKTLSKSPPKPLKDRKCQNLH